MPVPKKKTSYSKRHKRRSHHALKAVTYATCTSCGEPTLPHRVCSNCQNYKGKKILLVAE